MLTIEEAIEHAEDIAISAIGCECAEEHRQLATWLRELKERRKAQEIVRCKDCAYYNWDCVDAPYGLTKMICWCDLHYDVGNENLVVNPDDYCKWAERRTDEAKRSD